MAERTVHHVYVDESSQTGHGFMVIGAIICGRDAVAEIAEEMSLCLQRHGQRDDKEFHWTELKAHTLELYKDVLTRLIGFATRRRTMRYRALVVNMKQVDRSMSRDRNREAILATFIFTLVFGHAGRFEPNVRYRVWIDKRADSVHDLEMDVRTLDALNNKAMSEFGGEEGPFASVTFVDSKASRLIQAVDMLTGAVAYETNQKHLMSDASSHRIALWQHVLACSTLPTLASPTPRPPTGLEIARFEFTQIKTGN